MRAHKRYVAVAAVLFVLPTLVVGVLVYFQPELILSVVSSDTAASFEQMYSPGAASIGRTRDASTDWMMFGFYIRNNIGVAFQCFAGGLFAGLGTVFFLAYNGAFAGALAGYLTERGLSRTFYSFVATHSAFELTAIVLAGTAGLRLGHALLAPGRLHAARRARRRVARHGRAAVRRHGDAGAGRGRRGVLVVGQLAQPDRQVQRGGGVLGRRSRLLRLPGPPCRLTRSPSGFGRARRSRPPISASACVRAPRVR